LSDAIFYTELEIILIECNNILTQEFINTDIFVLIFKLFGLSAKNIWLAVLNLLWTEFAIIIWIEFEIIWIECQNIWIEHYF
jgi:hypothetical protein